MRAQTVLKGGFWFRTTPEYELVRDARELWIGVDVWQKDGEKEGKDVEG